MRRHFWRRLLPGVGVTTYMAANIVLGLGMPAVIMTGVFGLFTAREAMKFRGNLGRLRDLEVELATLTRADVVPSTPRDREDE